METAARLAGDDTGAGDALLRKADSVQVVDIMGWATPNPALDLARRLGAASAETAVSTVGGNSPQMLVNDAAADILAGRRDVVIIAGTHAVHSRHVAHRTGASLAWPEPADAPPPDRVVGVDRMGMTEAEAARSLLLPIQVYPIFETAIRLAAGASIAEHQARVSGFWARFSSVASTNPHAWDQVAHSASEISTAGPSNRWIGWPYTKLMNANIATDQAAALVLTSVSTAQSLGIPSDGWVFPWSGADSHDHWFVSDRWHLGTSPSMALNARAALGHVRMGIDEIARLDLYSCFPSAVQMGAAALGFSLDDADRVGTVTGGLAFAGGPGNNYVTHSIASMASALRSSGSSPGCVGLVSALGWYATKHSVGLYSTRPPAQPFATFKTQAEVDETPSRQAVPGYTGPAAVETWTVVHERDGSPSLGIVACLTPDGGRVWANTRRADNLAALMTLETGGQPAAVEPDGELKL